MPHRLDRRRLFRTYVLLPYYHHFPKCLLVNHAGILVPSCDRLHTCGDCARNTSCGWCESDNKCVIGDSFGPASQLCERYSYNSCPSLFFYSFGYVITVVCWLFMLGSAVFTIWQDYTLPENTKAQRFVIRYECDC